MLPTARLERLTRRFTEEVLTIIGPRMDVMAPDLGTDEQTMAWIMDTYSMKVGYACPEIVTGKPVELGGCVGRREATGPRRHLLHPGGDEGAEHAAGGIDGRGAGLRQRRLGRLPGTGPARRHASSPSATATAPSATRAASTSPALSRHVAGGQAAAGLPRRRADRPADLLTTPCTVLVPAALERVITGSNAAKLRCRILAEAANGPTTPEADAILADSDIFIIPDVLCNAGGVTVSYFEWVQDIQQFLWSEDAGQPEAAGADAAGVPPGAQPGRSSAS